MSPTSPLPETGTVRSESVTSTRDSASLLAELASQAIVLLQNADPHTVVTGLLRDKSYLHTQNSQLWKLVDKQRTTILELQRSYKQVLQDKARYQAQLKALKTQQLHQAARQSSQYLTSTESSAPIIIEVGPSEQASQSPSRRSSTRSTKSQRPQLSPRSPQAGAQLDALQASLEEEIAKPTDNQVSATSSAQYTENSSTDELNGESPKTDIPEFAPPLLKLESTTGPPTNRAKKVPTPLDLSAGRSRSSEPVSRSTFLSPRSLTPDPGKTGHLSPFHEPPPSAPLFQTLHPNNSSPSTHQERAAMLSPILPKSPQSHAPNFHQITPTSGKIIYDRSEHGGQQPRTPLTFASSKSSIDKPMSPGSGKAVYDEAEHPAQRSATVSTPRTSKPPTDTDELTEDSSSPNTASPTSSAEGVVESIRKSLSLTRRPRRPSHRKSNSASHSSSSSIMTISAPIMTPTSPPMQKVSRSMSVDLKEPLGFSLPSQDDFGRRVSLPFDDLNSLANSTDPRRSSSVRRTHSRNTSLTKVSLEETIDELQKANEQSEQVAAEETEGKEMQTIPEEPSRPPPPVPIPEKSPTGLQPAFTVKSRPPLTISKLVPLAITPADIPSMVLSVLSVRSRQIPSATGLVEETLFTIRCRAKDSADRLAEQEILRVEKSYTSIVELGDKLSDVEGISTFLSSFFGDFPTEKSNQRKALDYLFQTILKAQLDEDSLYTIAQFLSADIVQKHDSQSLDQRSNASTPTSAKSSTYTTSSLNIAKDSDAPTKEGYLTKRGKNFGGWQTRYFVLDGAQLKYYDAPNGVHLGSIKLPQAQIGRQTSQSQSEANESGDEQVKFAFLILEPKRNDASKVVRHVLCSQTEEDRDEWINALLHYISMDAEPVATQAPSEKSRGKRLQRRQNQDSASPTPNIPATQQLPSMEAVRAEQETIGVRYDHMIAGKQPTVLVNDANHQSTGSQDDTPRSVMVRTPDLRNDLRQPAPSVPVRSPYRAPISGPMNGAPITDESAWNSAQREEERRREEKRLKKRSMWAFLNKDTKGRSTPDEIRSTAPPPAALLQSGLFGIPLRDAVEITQEMGMGINVPSVIYRCIEYLEHMDAAKEEGIYRLSGSNSAIRMLKDKFNTEGDVDLVNSGEYHDIHAVAGLLKLYLRELPSTVLTRERHLEFLHIVDIEDKTKRVRKLAELVHALPKVNYELLRVMSKHLRRIVRRAQENKMTIRNVGIVFSPTLNIPAGVFSLFVTEYEVVFDEPDDVTDTTTPPAAPEAQSHPTYNNYDPPPTYHSNHHLNLPDPSGHRRYPSADPPNRGAVQVPHNQAYQESIQRPLVYQQQSHPQQTYQPQSYRQHPTPQASYQLGRWDNSNDSSSDLFG